MWFQNRRVKWEDLSSGQRTALSVLGALQVMLQLYALYDLVRRPAQQVRGGRKLPWLPVLFVNLVGPLTYLVVGRKRASGLSIVRRG